jgi:N-methylhydantoinase A/acetophenone carboxylase
MLKPGNRLEGPAILEGEYTTVVVPPAMKFSIDERGLGILES